MKYTLGIDVGTTGTKTVLLGEDGSIVSGGYYGYEVKTYPDKRSEQDADEWIAAVISTVKEAVAKVGKENIVGVSLSTQGATQVAVDKNGRPLADAITWMDVRSAKECAYIENALGHDVMYRKTGWRTDETCDAPKILWLKRNDRETWERTDKFLSTVEYVNLFLTGRAILDPTNGAIRELYNIETGKYDKDILEVIETGEEKLPESGKTGDLIGTVNAEAARLTELLEGTPVYLGAHDQYCASIGCGAVNEGDMLLSTGTAWVLLGVTDRLLFTPSHIAPGVHPKAGLYGAMASLGGVGNALKWVKDAFSSDYRTLDIEAAKRRESAREILFYPYFSGAAFPLRDNSRSGKIDGLRLCHDKYDIALALMEGVAFEVRLSLEKYREAGADIRNLKMMGGASRSELWSGIVSAVTGCELARLDNAEACALGAAKIAALHCGMIKDYSESSSGIVKLPSPSPEAVEFYNEKYFAYKKGI